MNKKENRGITLVALVITIIVLIILAGVSINAVMNDGLIGNAKEAKDEYDVAKEKEKIAITDLEVQTDFLKSGTPYLFRNGYLTGVTRAEKVKSLADKLPKGYYVYANGDTPTPIDNPDTTPVATEMLLMKGETEESAQKVGTIIVFGDVDCNGIIENIDGTEFARWYAGVEVNINLIAADTNHDGIVNDEDISAYRTGIFEQNAYASSLDELIIENSETKRSNIIEEIRKKYTVEYITWEYNGKEKTTDAITNTVDTTTIKDILDTISYEDIGIYRSSTKEVFKKGNAGNSTVLVQENDHLVLITGEYVEDGVVEYDTEKLQIYIVKQ